MGRNHKVSSWLVEGLTALVLGDMQLSLDALEEAVNLRTAYRITAIQVKTRKALVNTVVVDGGVYTGVSLSALYCDSCDKPFFKGHVDCHSCSKTLQCEAPGACYITGSTSAMRTNANMGAYFHFQIWHVYCTMCSSRFFTRTLSCNSCDRSTSLSEDFNACIDPPSSNAYASDSLSIEAMVREAFKEELDECDA